MAEPIAILGVGCRFPGGSDTPSKLWSVILDPPNLSRKPSTSRFNIDPFYHPVGTHHGTTNATKSYWLEDSDRSNVAKFDAGFFNIQPGEVNAMDPQQRLLMEVVYDSLCAAGQPMEKLRGSDTAVYVGCMCDDYNTMLTRDWETLPRYASTGLERGVLANRLSYFFDWHGPSLTVDTACSSSLVALDHAVQTIRSGRSKVAVAAGTSLILSPAMYISESNLGMLSPTGRCAMWDVGADGYARGEGVAAVVLKPLSQAIADNDPIDCIIRATGINQDGRTPGLTMPSSRAQTDLIRQCYAQAELDPINNPQDGPQFFQAHGTGTQAGDPQEAEAITNALFPPESCAAKYSGKLYVGSVKTVIGHTEGTAGLAGLISTSRALRHAVIPPNLHFENLNPAVAPFFKHLDIPTIPVAWPTGGNEIRRASVNRYVEAIFDLGMMYSPLRASFGFGGTNAHCILEAVPSRPTTKTASKVIFTPLVFSANSSTALRTMLSWHLDYLKTNADVELTDLAYTLQHRRSTLPHRKVIAGPDLQAVIHSLQNIVDPLSPGNDNIDLGTRFSTPVQPFRVIGIFTGQGAQWPRMCAELVENSPWAASRIDELDVVLQRLPNISDRPAWTLRDELLKPERTSRIAEAALSQPLCTAVQILLVDILREAGTSFTAVVGHSSGEIGAAYAAGFISAKDAIRIAYYRGVHAKRARSPNTHAPHGAMMAIGASFEAAKNLCCEDRFAGRIQVAAVNSGSSVTVSGDDDAVEEAERALKAQGTFARRLVVDTAYHSAHMAPCAGPYLASLASCGIEARHPRQGVTTTWFSSVYEGTAMTAEILTTQYWADNMCNTVLFAGALAQAKQQHGAFGLALEVGPHPALKGPATTVLDSSVSDKSTPYTGLLSRGQNSIEQLSAALGFIWTRLGYESVRFSAVQSLLSGNDHRMMLQDLPPYPFDHQRTYWISSRMPNHFKHRSATYVTNPVLGNPCSEAVTPGECQWRKILQPSEMPWLKGHRLQGQTVFPATGYVSMAIEAIKVLILGTHPDALISLIQVSDIDIPRVIAFDDDNNSVETIFSVFSVSIMEQKVTAEWACYSVAEGTANSVLNANGRALCHLSPMGPDTLPLLKTDPYNLVNVDKEHFYRNLSKIGYGYASPFRGLSNIRRKLGCSVGTLADESGSGWDENLIVHPGVLDSALQTVFAAWSYPGDTSIWSLHVPVHISTVTVNPYFTRLGDGGKQSTMQYESFIRSKIPARLVGDVYLHTADGVHTFVHMEGATLVPFSKASPKNDLPMFSHFKYEVASPDGQLATRGETMPERDIQMYKDVDRAAYWYARNAAQSIPAEERHGLLPHFQNYLSWCDRMVDMVSQGAHPKVKSECNTDSRESITQLLVRYGERKDVKFVQVVGDTLIPVIRAGTSMLEHMNQDGLLRGFYEENALCSGPTNRWLARIVSQISHRFPSLKLFEVGAGTGATTSAVFREIGDTYASYTFTDISSGFFLAAEERFAQEAGRMVFKTFDMEKRPAGQGFVEGLYDVVVAVNVLHVSGDLESSLSNVRRLLKPGGYLIVGELTSTDLLFTGMTVGTLPGWWVGAESGRPWGPLLDLQQWDSQLRKAGFAGIDTVTPDISVALPMNVFVTQAADDQITLLRNPLVARERPAGVRTNGLAIIGGTTPLVRTLGQEIAQILSHRFQNKQFFDSVEEFATSDMARLRAADEPITLLSLVDLDGPYLEHLTATKFRALKTLWAIAGTMVWVTCGSRKDNPYSHMMKGIINTVKSEHPNLSVQMYDLDVAVSADKDVRQLTATKLAVTLLRERILHEWGTESNLLWTSEPEVSVSDGKELITRLLPDVEKNKRYNSQRRDVTTIADPARETLELVGTGRGKDRSLELRKTSPLRLSMAPAAQHRLVRLKYSLLQTLAVGGTSFLRPCIGVDEVTGDAILALSGASESPAQVPMQRCIALPEMPAASTLISVAANLMAEYVLSLTPRGTTLLVHEPDRALRTALCPKAQRRDVKVIFTSTKLRHDETGASVFLHPNVPQHIIKATLPSSVAIFFHFSGSAESDAVAEAIIKNLPPACLTISEEALLSHEVYLSPVPDAETTLAPLLQRALDDCSQDAPQDISCIPLQDAIYHKGSGEPLAVVDWTASSSVMAKVQPIDSGMLFRADRTYLFAGMAGELGQSLAEWLIKHGARNVILTSRTPKVCPDFIRDMEKRHGAVVKAMSLDVTSRQSLEDVLKTITADMPCIGGVVNGAMVLEDDLFANMTLESFNRVAAPKVLGTQLLDQAFYDDASLDFFIVTSSIAAILGWTGQSNYSAANEFMTSLACNRRARGLAASTMNIPGVLGLGYAAHSDFDFEYFATLGHINIGEEDLHTLFAEAVFSGRPTQSSETQSQVAMGFKSIPADLEVKAAHKRDVKFSHFVQRGEDRVVTQAVKTSVQVKVLLQTTKSREEAFTITQDAFLAYLKHLLRITEDERDFDVSVGLIDQGVDSLVSVDIRAWFLKEMGVDVPTLKILGGASVADLVQSALEKMGESVGGETVAMDQKRSSSSFSFSSSGSGGSPVSTPASQTGDSMASTPPSEGYFVKGTAETAPVHVSTTSL